MMYLLLIHILCMFVTFNRETTGGQIDLRGTLLKILEVVSMGLLYTAILLAASQVTVWHTLKGDIKKIVKV
jgi:hypothetical protein